MKKPIICVTSIWDDKKNSLWMLPGYTEQTERAGGIPVILPITDDDANIRRIAGEFDGFLFTGGGDISPRYYGEHPVRCSEMCRPRDRMEEALFKEAVLNLKKPFFGICRGLQLMNALLGGDLYQDLKTQHSGEKEVIHYNPPGGDVARHKAVILKDTLLYDIFKTGGITVNSYHHQGIRTLADGLRPAAVSEDGLTEAAYIEDHPFAAAVQWHPELTPEDAYANMLFKAFVEACSAGNKKTARIANTDGFNIRQADISDIQTVLALIDDFASYENRSNEVTVTADLLNKWVFQENRAEIIIGEFDNKPVGFALFLYIYPSFTGCAGIYIEDLYVIPEMRKKGFGKALLKHAARTAAERGCDRLEWQCLNWNKPSMDFYLSIGAQPVKDWTIMRLTGDALAGLVK